jgi:tetratricopeptide (TPR) repeat protein
MRSFVLAPALTLACCLGAWAQNSSSSSGNSSGASQTSSGSSSSSSSGQSSGSSSTAAKKPSRPSIADLAPPRSDSVNADALPEGESSSKDTQIDLSPPAGDDKAHPKSDDVLVDESGTNDVGEFHSFDPHKAAKDVEVGDYYFHLKNYIGAESRYREALVYKENDAVATYRLAVCLEKMSRFDESRQEFESYLKILPNGPQAADAKKALEKLNRAEAKAK